MADRSPLSYAQAQRLAQFYADAEAEILSEIGRLLIANPGSYLLLWQREILQRIRRIRAELLAGSRTWCEQAIPAQYQEGMKWADIDPLSGKKLLAGFGGVHQQAVEVLAENAYGRLENVVQLVGRRTDDIYRKLSLEAIRGSVIGYKTTAQAARDIRDMLAERGITGFVDAAGHEWNMRRDAKMLAQETTNQAFRQGTINRFLEHGNDLVIVSQHTGSCPMCAPYQGKVFSLSGNDPDFPPISSATGLFHPGCKHVLSLAPEEKQRFLERARSS